MVHLEVLVISSFQKPTLNLSALSGKKHLDVRALEALLKHWPDCQSSPEGRRFYRWILPRADKGARRKVKKVSRFIDGGLTIKGEPGPQERKKLLHAECQQLCKDIVFRRQGVSNNREDENYRMGYCITCGKYELLQWGHFIAQLKSKYLQYHPDNSGGQGSYCNGPGGGMYAEYRAAIEKRKPGLAASLERMHAETKGKFRWTIASLTAQRDLLKRIWNQGG